MAIGTILIRADASIAMGTGHVMRCLALAEHCKDTGDNPVFAMAQSTPLLSARLESEGFKILHLNTTPGSSDDAGEVLNLAATHRASWVMVDGYQFRPQYYRQIKSAQLKLLVMDDNGEEESCFADLMLNQNLHADAALYPRREPTTRLLLGPRFALLRREFRPWKGWKRQISDSGRLKLLLTMGGSDPSELSSLALQALHPLIQRFSEIVLVVGGSNPNTAKLEAEISRFRAPIRMERDVKNIAEWMAWADLAVSAAGSTCWEMCLLGLPAIIIDAAPNQRLLARELSRHGAVVHVNAQTDLHSGKLTQELQFLTDSAEKRKLLSSAGHALVDGRGCARVASAMNSESITLRRATPEDSRVVWEWSNDPLVRQASFHSEFIPWEDHVIWFEKKMRDPEHFFFIAIDANNMPVGQVRLDASSGEGLEVSISVAPDQRGCGLGVELIRKAREAVWHEKARTPIHAFVKPENQISIRLFAEAGFRQVQAKAEDKQNAVHFVYDFSE